MLKLLDIHPCCSPLDIQLSYAFAGLSDTASLHWTPALLSRSPRFQDSSVLFPLTLSRPPAMLLLLDPQVRHRTAGPPACRHSTGPSVRHSSLDPQSCFAHPDPQFLIALLDLGHSSLCWTPGFAVAVSPHTASLHWTPSWQSHAILPTSLLYHPVGMSGQ